MMWKWLAGACLGAVVLSVPAGESAYGERSSLSAEKQAQLEGYLDCWEQHMEASLDPLESPSSLPAILRKILAKAKEAMKPRSAQVSGTPNLCIGSLNGDWQPGSAKPTHIVRAAYIPPKTPVNALPLGPDNGAGGAVTLDCEMIEQCFSNHPAGAKKVEMIAILIEEFHHAIQDLPLIRWKIAKCLTVQKGPLVSNSPKQGTAYLMLKWAVLAEQAYAELCNALMTLCHFELIYIDVEPRPTMIPKWRCLYAKRWYEKVCRYLGTFNTFAERACAHFEALEESYPDCVGYEPGTGEPKTFKIKMKNTKGEEVEVDVSPQGMKDNLSTYVEAAASLGEEKDEKLDEIKGN